ncbi:MAG: HEAT repeat domain-containing protein [Pirellulaceae bacterium]|nr:HEAT repeat domain-containing protein [Pirellulaceae bacterium]
MVTSLHRVSHTTRVPGGGSCVGVVATVVVGIAGWVADLGAGAGVLGAVEAEWIMYQDPRLPAPAVEVQFPAGLTALWSQALESPERELRRRAAESIVRARALGMAGLDVTTPALLDALRTAEDERLVRLTAAQALAALDAQPAAPALCEKLDGQDLDLAEVVEPALARWKYAPMADVWRTRLNGAVGLHRLHVLAIRGLTALGDVASLPRLRELAVDHRTPMNVRWEAALALGLLQTEGLEETARTLSGDKSPSALNDRLVATAMLRSHRGESVQTLLAELAGDPTPVVRALALEHLYGIDPELILPLIDQTIACPDVNVRRWGAAALFARPSPQRVDLLAHMLNDADPPLRRSVCANLLAIARSEALQAPVVEAGRRELAADTWRGQEQAILLLVTLDDKTIADRLLGLLAAERIEVHTTAAWGLSRLAVPSTLPRILEVFTVETDRQLADERIAPGMHIQLSHLAQALGQMKYAPAEEQLRKYVPKDWRFAQETRAAAIWALGHLHAGTPDDDLANQLVARLNDVQGMMPELALVRRLAAVSLGRMHAQSSLEDLRRMATLEGSQSAVGIACAWAIHEITGEPMPSVRPLIQWESEWFLQPFKNPPAQ